VSDELGSEILRALEEAINASFEQGGGIKIKGNPDA
jgi:hypothetical protein